PELARDVGERLDTDRTRELAVDHRVRDLPGRDELGDLQGARPRRVAPPEPFFGRRVDVVDEAREALDEGGLPRGRGVEEADGDRARHAVAPATDAHRSRV